MLLLLFYSQKPLLLVSVSESADAATVRMLQFLFLKPEAMIWAHEGVNEL